MNALYPERFDAARPASSSGRWSDADGARQGRRSAPALSEYRRARSQREQLERLKRP